MKNLHTAWARQLHNEFCDICWKYGVQLAPPVIEIAHSASRFGSWTPGNRTIQISHHLITDYSWATVIHVFKHEMAHQLCSEIFLDPTPGHGRSFQKACAMLGVPAPFQKAGGDLPAQSAMPATDQPQVREGRRFIEKVEKLLALAGSCNEHEAALAMKKANELILKYNIRQGDAEEHANYTFTILNNKKRQIQGYQRQICMILSDFFFVRVILSDLYDAQTDQTHKTIELLGKTENVTVAEYCYHFLENQLKLLWQQNRHKFKGSARTERNSYYLGLLKGFHAKLKQQHTTPVSRSAPPRHEQEQEKTAGALTMAADSGLSHYISMRFPRLRHIAQSGPRIYESTYQEGIQTGGTIVLHKGVAKSDGSSGKLLAH